MRLRSASIALAFAACTPSSEPATAAMQSPILGPSHPAAVDEFPATGALLSGALGSLELECTGTLIAPNAVLTAAHCVDPQLIGTEIPQFTFERYAHVPPAGKVHAGSSVHPHPAFEPNVPIGQLGQVNDIGILLLAEPIADVAPATLVTADDATRLVVDLGVTLIGYGYSDGNDVDAGIPGFEYKRVGHSHITQLVPWELALAQVGVDAGACSGDSGGPVYAAIGDQGALRLAATVSRGLAFEDCSKGGIYTRVDPYLAWIDSIARPTCGRPGLPACAEPDGGIPDDGGGGVPPTPAGCGCYAGGADGPLLVGLVMLGLGWGGGTRRRIGPRPRRPRGAEPRVRRRR